LRLNIVLCRARFAVPACTSTGYRKEIILNQTENTFASRLMSPSDAAAATTMSKTLLRSMAAEGQFPAPLQIGVKRIAYVRAEVESWIDERIASRSAMN